MSELERLRLVLRKVRERKPVVVQVTNFVSASFQAACTLAIGAHTIMPVNSLEIEDILNEADSLLVNIGTLDEGRRDCIVKGIEIAKERGIPVVLDPVGCGVSEHRRGLVLKLLREGKLSIVKGNGGEILSIYGESKVMKGVDAVEDLKEERLGDVVKELALMHSSVFVATGRINYLSDGHKSLRLSGGEEIMKSVSGIGCSLGSVMAVFLTVLEPLDAAVYALELFSEVSRRAWSKARGPESFKVSLVDELYALGREEW